MIKPTHQPRKTKRRFHIRIDSLSGWQLKGTECSATDCRTQAHKFEDEFDPPPRWILGHKPVGA